MSTNRSDAGKTYAAYQDGFEVLDGVLRQLATILGIGEDADLDDVTEAATQMVAELHQARRELAERTAEVEQTCRVLLNAQTDLHDAKEAHTAAMAAEAARYEQLVATTTEMLAISARGQESARAHGEILTQRLDAMRERAETAEAELSATQEKLSTRALELREAREELEKRPVARSPRAVLLDDANAALEVARTRVQDLSAQLAVAIRDRAAALHDRDRALEALHAVDRYLGGSPVRPIGDDRVRIIRERMQTRDVRIERLTAALSKLQVAGSSGGKTK